MEKFSKVSGTSLLVPSVQELAKQNLVSIPQRYIQPQNHQQMLHISQQPNVGTLQIPVIDMHRLLSQESGTSELDKLHLACKEWGFFQLINHGISSSMVEKVQLEMKDFFNLPMTEKEKFWQTPENIEGFGQAFVLSEDQKLDWADMFYMITLPEHSRMPHLFPQLPLPFRDTLEVYSKKLKDLAMDILGHLAKALGIEEVEIRELFEDGIQMMRMNYYPPSPEPEKVIGLTNHSDPQALTILLQLNEPEGLQIRKDGMWVPVNPLPNSFIVNVGDILEIITNGTYRSVEHRATVNSEKERLSCATFYSPREDAVICPSPCLITDQTPPQFKSIRVDQYFKDFFARKLEGKSNRDYMKIDHPN
ncbi:protein SRG1-like [Vigna unguiculata]|uniref:protein SRG1-like n=1 Tax=Vigna unguiculata TaxID=3917 RepID=UPI0010163F02|nr:protein SRG1-like [Vigna unguiculata]